MRGSVEAVILLLNEKNSARSEGGTGSQIVGLAQSSILCIDLICHHIVENSRATFVDKIEGCLDLLMTLMSRITTATQDSSSTNLFRLDPATIVELVKLQGSNILCSVAIVGTIGPRVLPKLGVSLI
jgi:hypothetical protein